MTIELRRLDVDGISVEVIRKRIKNIHLAVYPPDGRVRIAVPTHIDDDAARLAVVTRLPWVRRRRLSVIEQARESEHEMVSGESHYVAGDRFRLQVLEHQGPPLVEIHGGRRLQLRVRPGTDRSARKGILERWYRQRLKAQLPELIDQWSIKLGVEVRSWGVRKMKTKWGSCSLAAGRIWLNLELAKKSLRCLEYVLVHEMIHLIEPSHNDRFQRLMAIHLPSWESRRAELNRSPLGFEHWEY